MLAILVIVPLIVGAFASLLLSNRPKYVKYIALAASLVSLTMAVSISSAYTAPAQSFTWFSLGSVSFPITTYTFWPNTLLLLIVAGMTPLVFIYSIGFMDVPSEQGRFYFEMCLFAAAMMLFSIAGNFITLLIGWGLLGITSYLLIGFWYRKERAPAAARKAITIVLIGDILMLMAIVMMWNTNHSFDFISVTTTPIALVLILIAAFTKSAQFPFHEWLPDAMEGPTPVSAFLHSSTMVKAGVFLVAVLLPSLLYAHLLYLLIIVGVVTAVFGVTNALAETHIKRVLAYSTLEDLGLMFVALGFDALPAAMFLLLVQTFYKAMLFMSAGAIIKANDGEEQISRLRTSQAGRAFKIATLIGALSLAGVFPLSGFFGKAAVEYASINTLAYGNVVSTGNTSVYNAARYAPANALVFATLMAIGFASSLYIFRWMLVPMRRPVGPVYVGTGTNFKLLPKSMLVPVYVLAAGAAIAGLLVFSSGYLGSAGSLVPLTNEDLGTETIVVLLGVGLAYLLYFKHSGPTPMKAHRFVYSVLYNSMLVNWLYALAAKFVVLVVTVVDTVDRALYGFVKALGVVLVGFAGAVRRIENGMPNTYVLAFVLGVIAIVIILMV